MLRYILSSCNFTVERLYSTRACGNQLHVLQVPVKIQTRTPPIPTKMCMDILQFLQEYSGILGEIRHDRFFLHNSKLIICWLLLGTTRYGQFMGTFAQSQKAPVSFVMSVRPPACISVDSTGRKSVKFDIGGFCRNLLTTS
jgi:hypothetical protein